MGVRYGLGCGALFRYHGSSSGLDLVSAAGTKIPVTSSVSDDGKTISGAPARPLAAGAYVVNWRVASPDGHRMTGSTNFSVR